MSRHICLNMIVKDEAEIIGKTLANIISVVPVDYWVIHDTGSADLTKEVILQFFEEANIPGELKKVPWKNFGANRQFALEQAEGSAQYALFFDADCQVSGTFGSLEPEVDSYSINSVRNGILYPVKHIVRNDGSFRWRGVVHEGLYFSGHREVSKTMTGLTVTNNSLGSRSKLNTTYFNDARLLVDAIKESSLEDRDLLPRYMFYAANSFRDAKCFREAAHWYQKRIELGGWIDEVFVSYLNLGVALKESGDTVGAIEAWLAGSDLCPDRAECLYKLAQVERENGRINLALIYAEAAFRIPLPSQHRLFVWRDVYRYWAAFELAWTLKLLGRLTENDEALERLMQVAAPPHLFRILGHNEK